MTPPAPKGKNPPEAKGGLRGEMVPPLKSRRAAAPVSPAGETRLFEEVAACENSYTGQYLKKLLEK